MKINRLLLTFVCASAIASVSAEDEGNYLHIRTSEGWEVLSLNQVDKLTFSGGVMTATDKNNATVATFPQSSLETMYFDETAGIITPTVENTAATFTYNAATRTVTMLTDGDFCVYTPAGSRIVNITNAKKGETIVLSGLEEGIAILNTGKYSLKTVIK